MKKIVALMALLASLYASWSNAAGRVENPWVREAPPTAMALGAFMVLHNDGDEPLVLVGAETSVAGEVQLHRTIIENETARMVHQPNISIPARSSLEFKPGDYHLMLMKPRQKLKAGDEIEITLQFEDGSSQSATFAVHKGMPMEQDMHHHHH